jgi:hypothetical protein
MKTISKPNGLFRGRNFMTPDVIAYYKLRKGHAELSEGTGITHKPIYGVTVEPDAENTRSRMFHSKAEALNYIDALSDSGE